MRAPYRNVESKPLTFAEQFEAARRQAAPRSKLKPRKLDGPFHLKCLHCGAEGHSTSLGNRILAWFWYDSRSFALGSLGTEPLECFDRQVGCGKCGSHELEGINRPSFASFH